VHHEVTLAADWSLDTPHDLPAERLGAALGGFCSCLHLIDVVLPAARIWLDVNARVRPAELARGKQGMWFPARRADHCCSPAQRPRGFTTAMLAGEHARSVRHIAAREGADPRLLASVTRALARAQASIGSLVLSDDDISRVGPLVSKSGSGTVHTEVLALWGAGLGPRAIGHLHRTVDIGPHPLPVALYLALAFEKLDTGFAHRTLRAGTEDRNGSELADFATWVAETMTPFDRSHPDQRHKLLALGFTRRLAHEMSLHAVLTEDICAYARGTGLSVVAAGQTLAAWAGAGAVTDVAVMVRAVQLGMSPTFRFGPKTLREVRRHVPRGPDISAFQIGIAVGICGSAMEAAYWLRQGITEPDGFAARMVATSEQSPRIAHQVERRRTKE
jgi:hypothetical protein